MVDHVLVMTVNPGFGGQAYIPTMLNKIRDLRCTILERDLDIDIEVDGGIKANWTLSQCCAAGAQGPGPRLPPSNDALEASILFFMYSGR